MHRVVMVLGGVLAFAACEQSSPSLLHMSSLEPASFLLASPDPDFRLAETERARLPSTIDPEALERLLARIRPEHRSVVIRDLSELGSQERIAFGPGTTSIPDPEFRAAVAAVFRIPSRDASSRP